MSLCETHLKQKQVIVVENYIFYGHNREKTHIKAKKTYGGVGVLVSLRLYGNYDIKIVDKSVDGILGVSFKNKYTERCFVIFSCYLPPETMGSGR